MRISLLQQQPKYKNYTQHIYFTSVNIYVLKYNTLIYYIVTSYIFNNLLLCFVVACKTKQKSKSNNIKKIVLKQNMK